MKTRVAINGFGRIGRNAFKVAFERSDIEIVAVNDTASPATLAYLLKHDSVYGAYHHQVSSDPTNIIINGVPVKVLSESAPAEYPWRDLGVDVVIESGGTEMTEAALRSHLSQGARRVVAAAPVKGVPAIIMGSNEESLTKDMELVSASSCVGVCAVPVLSAIDASFGVNQVSIASVHSYTAQQNLIDGPAITLREARAAALNIVPRTVTDDAGISDVLAPLTGKIQFASYSVPTQVVSLVDMTIQVQKGTNAEEVNQALSTAAAEPYYQGILSVSEEELVSSDYIGNSHSAVVDARMTQVVDGTSVRVVAWHDNEWGYANRLVEIVSDFGKLLQ